MAKNNKSSNRRTEFSSPNRRKFLIGAGSIAAGGSALLGTAATTTFSLNDRAVSANVVTDSSGAIALTDTEQGDIINLTSASAQLGEGELEIDFTQGGAGGVNVGSVVNVGDFGNLNSDSANDAAFTITNQTTDVVDVDVEFVANNKYNAPIGSASELKFQFANTDNTTAEHTLVVSHDEGVENSGDSVITSFSASGSGEPLKDGESIDVAIQVDADNASSAVQDNLSGDLNITATQG